MFNMELMNFELHFFENLGHMWIWEEAPNFFC